MRLIDFFKRPRTAPVARERLQILLAHERAVSGKSDLIAILREEILAVVAKHFPVEQEGITVKMERGDVVSTLEVEVEIPTPMCPSFPLPKKQIPREAERSAAPEPEEAGLAESAGPDEAESDCTAEATTAG